MTPLQIALLNRWASYRVSVGLARACGWPKPLPAEPIRVPAGLSALPDGTCVSLRVYDDGSKSVAVWEDS